jgi:hypothetical protein
MAVVDTQELPVAGLDALVWSPASGGGDEVPTNRRVVLLVRNTDASSHAFTVATPATVDGLAVADVTRTVAADAVAAVPMRDVYHSPTTARAAITWAATTGMEFAAVELPM